MMLYRVLVYKSINNVRFCEPEVFEFNDIQEALGKYDYEMKMDHNDLTWFCIKVQKKTDKGGYWWPLIVFSCDVGELNVLLKSS